MVWNCRLRGQHMRKMRHIFQIQAKTLAGSPLTQSDCEALNAVWAEVVANGWEQWSDTIWPPRCCVEKPHRIIITDASDSRWSWLELAQPRMVGTNPNGQFEPSMRAKAIFYKELFAVVCAMRSLASRGEAGVRIVLVGDNKAVIGAISKMMGPEDAWDMLDEIFKLTVENQWSPLPEVGRIARERSTQRNTRGTSRRGPS